MAKGMYIGVGGVARKVKKMYFGVDGVARKVKKAYMGVDGVARCIFSGGELEYYGTATSLSAARSELAATTVGNYALFSGGNISNSSYSSVVDAYNTSLTRSIPKALSVARNALAATTVGDYALFGGGIGRSSTQSTYTYSTVDAYNTSLTRSIPTALSARYDLAATTVGNYALFGGGSSRYTSTGGNTKYSPVTSAYDSSLTISAPTNLSVARSGLAATTVGNYALFGGGYNGSSSLSTVDAYDQFLTRSNPTALNTGLGAKFLAATTVGNYALFGGGTNTNNTYISYVSAYDSSLTISAPTNLSVARSVLAATTVGNYALFGGGYNGMKTVDAYNSSLTRSSSTELSKARGKLTATTVGNYALFGGGYDGSSSYLSTVDVYTAES